MKRILFVDDEPKILQGLERLFHHKRETWEMVFAVGGEAGLEELRKSFFDVVVSDMRMPKIDGAMLLKEVQDLYPHTIRIVLSGYAEMETALRAIPVAHQFLAKPCKAEQLEDAVRQACDLQALLKDDALKNIIGKIDHLPTLPKIHRALTRALAQPNMSVKEIADIVEEDMAISAKVLQLVNSAFFGLSRSVTNIQTAVSCIGLNLLRHLALSVEVFQAFEGTRAAQGFLFEQLRRHAVLTADIAKRMFTDTQKSEDAFAAGILHDIGKLILMACLPEKFEMVMKATDGDEEKYFAAEKEIIGVTHAEVGAYLLGIWGLPYSVIEAVAYHHEPWKMKRREFDVLSAVYLANCLAQDGECVSIDKIDMEYLNTLGVADRLPAWKQTAEGLHHYRKGG